MTYHVTGSVKHHGQAVEGADVVFYPVDPNSPIKPAQAATDAEGKFSVRIRTASGDYKDGMEPGDYTVAVSKTDSSNVTDTLTPPKQLLPEKFGNPQTSGLTASVTADGENHFDFNLLPASSDMQ